MRSILTNRKFVLGFIAILVVTLPLLVMLVLRQQDLRQRASSLVPITFQLSPASSSVTPGSIFNVDLVMNAGTYDIGSLHFLMTYDSSLVDVSVLSKGTALATALETNRNGTFETTMLNSGSTPVTGNGLKVLTFQVQVKSGVQTGVAHLAVTPGIQATATGQNSYIPVDNESNITGAYTISAGPTLSPGITITPQPTLSPTLTVAPTITNVPTLTPSPTPTQIPTLTPLPSPSPTSGIPGGSIGISATLPGIGSNTGDNNDPKNETRTFEVYAFNDKNQEVANTKLSLKYVKPTGSYVGVAILNNLPNGPYTIKLRADNSLIKIIPGIYNIESGKVANTPTVPLVSGDIMSNGESKNLLDVDDYNALLSCLQGGSCDALSDLNDDGFVNSKDFNILLRGFATRKGD